MPSYLHEYVSRCLTEDDQLDSLNLRKKASMLLIGTQQDVAEDLAQIEKVGRNISDNCSSYYSSFLQFRFYELIILEMLLPEIFTSLDSPFYPCRNSKHVNGIQ